MFQKDTREVTGTAIVVNEALQDAVRRMRGTMKVNKFAQLAVSRVLPNMHKSHGILFYPIRCDDRLDRGKEIQKGPYIYGNDKT